MTLQDPKQQVRAPYAVTLLCAAQALQCDVKRVRRLLADGVLKKVYIGRSLYVSGASVNALIRWARDNS